MVSIPHLFYIVSHRLLHCSFSGLLQRSNHIFFIIVFKLFNQNKRRCDVISCFIPAVHSIFCDFLPSTFLKLVEIFLIPFSLFLPEDKIGNIKVLNLVDNSPLTESSVE